jgi:phosphoglycerol geranylgeranyltransferase
MNVKEVLLGKNNPGARHVVLLDPDKLNAESAATAAAKCSKAGVDALFVGGSTGDRAAFANIIGIIKRNSKIPVILFPGSFEQIVPETDAVLFMSLLSGRNPRFLIEEQVKGAGLVKKYGLETIAMGYLLIESDKPSAVEKVSGTKPIPRKDVESAVNHALAAQYFGMDVVYLEGGSGVGLSVPNEMIKAVKTAIDIPLIVGGGIRSPDEAREKVLAGADIIVTGNVLEEKGIDRMLGDFVREIHSC